MILTAGKTNVTKLLAGDAAGTKIAQICVGTDGTAASAGDTTLTNEVAVPVDSVIYPAADIEEFIGALPDTVPAMVIAEIGLRDEAGNLVHRKVVSPTFNKAFGLQYTLRYQVKVV